VVELTVPAHGLAVFHDDVTSLAHCLAIADESILHRKVSAVVSLLHQIDVMLVLFVACSSLHLLLEPRSPILCVIETHGFSFFIR
jgi:hypothetical protein